MNSPRSTLRDPRPRPDNRCARPGCGKPLRTTPPATMPKSLRPDFLRELAAEPYCSTECCRIAYGCPLPMQLDKEAKT